MQNIPGSNGSNQKCRRYRADSGCATDGRTDGRSKTNILHNNFVVRRYNYSHVFSINSMVYFNSSKWSITITTTMEPGVVWEFPSPPIGVIDCRDVIIQKPCIVGAQLDSVTIATGLPYSIVIVSQHRVKIHSSDNFLDIRNDCLNPFTLSTAVKCVHLNVFSSRGWLTWSCFVYIRLPFWRHRTCIATYSPGKTALTWSWWYRFNCG